MPLTQVQFKTNHLQSLRAYCFFQHIAVDVPGPHIEEVCVGKTCPYLNGSFQGEGIECLWYDGSGEPIDFQPSIYALAIRGQMMREEKRLEHQEPLEVTERGADYTRYDDW